MIKNAGCMIDEQVMKKTGLTRICMCKTIRRLAKECGVNGGSLANVYLVDGKVRIDTSYGSLETDIDMLVGKKIEQNKVRMKAGNNHNGHELPASSGGGS